MLYKTGMKKIFSLYSLSQNVMKSTVLKDLVLSKTKNVKIKVRSDVNQKRAWGYMEFFDGAKWSRKRAKPTTLCFGQQQELNLKKMLKRPKRCQCRVQADHRVYSYTRKNYIKKKCPESYKMDSGWYFWKIRTQPNLFNCCKQHWIQFHRRMLNRYTKRTENCFLQILKNSNTNGI